MSVFDSVIAYEFDHLLHHNYDDRLEGCAVMRHAGLEGAEGATGILGGRG
ncbi:hypothetical protein [Anabaena sp. CCY 9910]